MATDKAWDGSASRYTPQQWKKACVLHVCEGDEKSCHKLPIREPGGALNKNGVHAAAQRVSSVKGASPEQIASAKRQLRGAYDQLGEEPPDAIAASAAVEAADRIPENLEDYWTHGEGAAKVRWGEPGDFDRCRKHLAKYVPPGQLSGMCANLHHKALGKWPGQEATVTGGEPGPAITDPDDCGCGSLVASGAADDFMAPLLSGPTPLTVDGRRIFGHLATWGQCHIGYGDTCVTAPKSETGYAYFLTGEVVTDDGESIPVGQITLGTGHAAPRASAHAAAQHYDDTGTVIADICVGDDPHGIWYAGRIRDEATPEQVDALRAANLSGDWRRIGGHMELVAALAVNVPGFPVPRVTVAASGGRQESLVAAGIVRPPQQRRLTLAQRLARETVAEVSRLNERRRRAERAAASIGRDRRSRALAAVRKFDQE